MAQETISRADGLRAGLVTQFLWASQQTVEKYLKCILLLNRIRANDVVVIANAASKENQGMSFTRVPGFLPSQSGFHFSNNYPYGTPYPAVNLPIVGTIISGDAGNGLCGGFVMATLDLFRS